jgi:hypothetical protein
MDFNEMLQTSRAQGPPPDEQGRSKREQEVDHARLRAGNEGQHGPDCQGDQRDEEGDHPVPFFDLLTVYGRESVDGVCTWSYFNLE